MHTPPAGNDWIDPLGHGAPVGFAVGVTVTVGLGVGVAVTVGVGVGVPEAIPKADAATATSVKSVVSPETKKSLSLMKMRRAGSDELEGSP